MWQEAEAVVTVANRRCKTPDLGKAAGLTLAVLCNEGKLFEFIWRWQLSIDLLLSLGVTMWSS